MKTKRLILWIGAALLGFYGLSAQAIPSLFDYGFNIDGTASVWSLGDPLPAEVNFSSFDDIAGLGSITATITGAGSHTFDAFFDHEIDETTNTYFNEWGAAHGTAAAGQSWEIDEPGFVFGDIYDNFLLSALDNFNNVPDGLDDDVSMALGWDFTLGAGETAVITLLLSDIDTGGSFYLSQTDPDSPYTFYLSSALNIRGGVPTPEPSILFLLGIGMLGFIVSRRRMNKA